MEHHRFKVFQEFFTGIRQGKEVIFFGGLDQNSFDITYSLYRLHIKHEFVIYDETMSLQILSVRTVCGYSEIRDYLDSFRYVLDIT